MALPKGWNVRDWPLADEERGLILEAREFAAGSLRKIQSKYKDVAAEIESEFTYQLCTGIHKWDRRVSLYWWAIWRLKLAMTVVFRELPGGTRDPATMAGAKIYSLSPLDDKPDGSSVESPEFTIDDLALS